MPRHALTRRTLILSGLATTIVTPAIAQDREQLPAEPGVRRNISRPVRFFCMTEHSEGLHPEIEVLPLQVEPFAEPMAAALAVALGCRQEDVRAVLRGRGDGEVAALLDAT